MHEHNPRSYLNVPYAEKDLAKQLGAKWDTTKKKWFIPLGVEPTNFEKWTIENNSFSQSVAQSVKLTIELVPETCWYTNVRSEVSEETWNFLRKQTYRNANYQCKICGGKGNTHPVECHEIWDYNDRKKIQTLNGLIALCPSCHKCKHIGYATMTGNGDIAAKHLAHVNSWSQKQADNYIERCFDIWRERSFFEWTLDISYLDSISD
jgi:Domain of unknown function (DUF5710)